MKIQITISALLLLSISAWATTNCPEKMMFSILKNSKCPDSCYVRPDKRLHFSVKATPEVTDVSMKQSSQGEETTNYKSDNCPQEVIKIAERKADALGRFENSLVCMKKSTRGIRVEISPIPSYAPTDELKDFNGWFEIKFYCL